MNPNDPSGSSSQEQENVELMISMMGGSIDASEARRLLRESNGDINKAMNAMFEPAAAVPQSQANIIEDRAKHNNTPGSSFTKNWTSDDNNVIDLTTDDDLTMQDDDLARALKASLEPLASGTHFGPSDRAPHPDWAVVPSNVEAPSNDQSLSRAIEASLSSGLEESTMERYEVPDMGGIMREDNRPVALRPNHPKHAYAALVTHGLFAITELRRQIAALQIPSDESSDASPLAPLQRLFVNMDLSKISPLSTEEFLKPFKLPHWSSLRAGEGPGDLTLGFLNRAIVSIESCLCQVNNDKPVRLFHFSHGRVDLKSEHYEPKSCDEIGIVQVDSSPENIHSPNDLVSRLNSQLAQEETIIEPSHVVIFHLSPTTQAAPNAGIASRRSFRYPLIFYLDQFLLENIRLVKSKRERQQAMAEEIKKLTLQKATLTHFNGKDTLGDLRASLFYYDNVADADGDPERAIVIQRTSQKLKNIIAAVESKVEILDQQIAQLTIDSDTLLDVPELQKHKYHLQVVLYHNGLYGLKNIYSYTLQGNVWWRTVDCEVTQVSEETVLADESGVHLQAGPYLLIYCRSGGEDNTPISWPQAAVEEVMRNNSQYISFLANNSLAGHIAPVQADVTMETQRDDSQRMDESID